MIQVEEISVEGKILNCCGGVPTVIPNVDHSPSIPKLRLVSTWYAGCLRAYSNQKDSIQFSGGIDNDRRSFFDRHYELLVAERDVQREEK